MTDELPSAIGNRCHVIGRGRERRVVPGSSARNPAAGEWRQEVDGVVYRGSGLRFEVVGGRRHQVIAKRAVAEEAAAAEPAVSLYDSRFVTFYWLKEERNITTATTTYGSAAEPIVGVHGYPSGALTGVIFNFAFPGSGPDPALVASSGGPLDWPLLSYEGAPFYPSGGFWVEGFDPPIPAGGVPWTVNLSVGLLKTASFTDGFGELWEWDFKAIGVREYKLAAQTWPENYGY